MSSSSSSSSSLGLQRVLFNSSKSGPILVYAPSPAQFLQPNQLVSIRYQDKENSKPYEVHRGQLVFDAAAIANYIRNPKKRKTPSTDHVDEDESKKKKKKKRVVKTPEEKKASKSSKRTKEEKKKEKEDAEAFMKTIEYPCVRLFTDGSCRPNPGWAGCAAIGLFPSQSFQNHNRGSSSSSSSSSTVTCSSSSSASTGSSSSMNLSSHGSVIPILEQEQAVRLNRKAFVGKNKTNNVAELKAVELGLDLLEDYEETYHVSLRNMVRKIYIFADSQYVIGMLWKGFQASTNKKLIEYLRQRLLAITSQGISIIFHHVAGHVGIKENEEVDQLANEALIEGKQLDETKQKELVEKSMKEGKTWVTTILGNLCDATEEYIVHQCNCRTYTAKGVASALFQRFPYANSYRIRQTPSSTGSIERFGDGKEQRFIVSFYAQRNCGPCSYSSETYEQRLEWFESCFEQLIHQYHPKSIAMPFKIGCGLAGGDWNIYLALLKRLAASFHVPIVLYDFSSNSSLSSSASSSSSLSLSSSSSSSLSAPASVPVPIPIPIPIPIPSFSNSASVLNTNALLSNSLLLL